MYTKLCAVAISVVAVISPPLKAETPVYGVMLHSGSPYWEAVKKGLVEGASLAQADIYLQATQENTAQPDVELCSSMLDRKPNVLLLATPDTIDYSTCLEKARWLNIPVVGISDSINATQNTDITSFTMVNEADNPHSLGVKAMEVASQAIASANTDGA